MSILSNEINEIIIDKPYGFIYITTNIINGKRYLGQKKFDDRWQSYLGSGEILKKAIKKYGKENFARNIIDIAYSDDELSQKEYDYSVFFNVVESDDWYNLVYGGSTINGYKFSEEQRKHMSEIRRGERHPLYGKFHTDETKEKIRTALKGKYVGENHHNYGKQLSEETKYKISKANTGRVVSQEIKDKLSEKNSGKNNHFYNKHHTKDTKEKIIHSQLRTFLCEDGSECLKNMNSEYCNPRAFPVYSIEFNKIFWGAKEVHNIYGVIASDVTKCCKGKIKSCGKHPDTGEKLHWVYVLDQTQKDDSIIYGAISLGYITQQDYNEFLDNIKQERN